MAAFFTLSCIMNFERRYIIRYYLSKLPNLENQSLLENSCLLNDLSLSISLCVVPHSKHYVEAQKYHKFTPLSAFPPTGHGCRDEMKHIPFSPVAIFHLVIKKGYYEQRLLFSIF